MIQPIHVLFQNAVYVPNEEVVPCPPGRLTLSCLLNALVPRHVPARVEVGTCGSPVRVQKTTIESPFNPYLECSMSLFVLGVGV